MNDHTSGVLAAPILAVDRLNSWVRSKSYRSRMTDISTSLKHFIYHLKMQAIEAARDHGLLEPLAGVMVKVKCRTCGGTGIWHSWHSESNDPGKPCRK